MIAILCLSYSSVAAHGFGREIYIIYGIFLAGICLAAIIIIIFMILIAKKYKKMPPRKKPIVLTIFTTIILLIIAIVVYNNTHLFEREVGDEYLVKLFTPNQPYESVKMKANINGQRYIVINLGEDITFNNSLAFRKLLLSRGVSIYGSFWDGSHFGIFHWKRRTTQSAITITRKVKEDSDAVEISECLVRDRSTGEPIEIISSSGREIRLAITDDFGKRWKKIKIVPDKEPDAAEPSVGRHPESKLREMCRLLNGDKSWVYVSRTSLKEVYAFYVKKIMESYPQINKDPFEKTKDQDATDLIEVFGYSMEPEKAIKTEGRMFTIRGFERGKKEYVDIEGRQSADRNLKEFVEIKIKEKSMK